MKKRAVMLILAAAVCTLLFGCKKEEPVVESNPEPVIQMTEPEKEKEPEPVAEEPAEEEEEEVNPGFYRSELTNEWIEEGLKNQRPIAAMVDNESTALPHFGVNDCDIVYEMTNSHANGGITRLMCIIKDWGKIEQLGSIRSVRPTNLQLAPEYGAVVCHDGGPFYIDIFLKNDFVKHFSGTFSRVNNGKSREFTEYILSGDLEKNFKNTGITTEYDQYYQGGQHFNFASEKKPVDLSEKSDSKTAEAIDLPFEHNKSKLRYDDASGKYLYSEYGSAHVDGKTGEQTSFKNVFLLSAEMQVFDKNGYMMFITSPVSGREGYYCTGGKAVPITWSNSDDISYTRYFDKDGNELKINTGHTYIAIIPEGDYPNLVIE
ncbi:MAG: DUF3048 domain-containing protein [Lachnospiraceae bacterium]|nr:DUF3048 domain-containing protein [Lachnospiraceae bacterium]